MGVGVYTPKNLGNSQMDENEDIWDQIAGYDDIKQVFTLLRVWLNRILRIQLFYLSNILKNTVKLLEKQERSK